MNNQNGNKIYEEPGMYTEAVDIDEESLMPGLNDPPEKMETAKKILKLIAETELVLQAVKAGKMKGEYGEF